MYIRRAEQLLSVQQPMIMAKPLAVRYIAELGRIEYITRFVEILRILQFQTPFAFFAHRIHVKLDCSMDFRYYPADTQSCLATIRPCKFICSHTFFGNDYNCQ